MVAFQMPGTGDVGNNTEINRKIDTIATGSAKKDVRKHIPLTQPVSSQQSRLTKFGNKLVRWLQRLKASIYVLVLRKPITYHKRYFLGH